MIKSFFRKFKSARMASKVVGVILAADCPCGGSKMLIEDGVNGYLSDFSAEVFSEKLAALLADKGLRARMSSAAREKAQAYRSSRVVDEWEALLVSLARKRKG